MFALLVCVVLFVGWHCNEFLFVFLRMPSIDNLACETVPSPPLAIGEGCRGIVW